MQRFRIFQEQWQLFQEQWQRYKRAQPPEKEQTRQKVHPRSRVQFGKTP